MSESRTLLTTYGRKERERERVQDRDVIEVRGGRSRARVISKAGRKYPFLRRLTGGGGGCGGSAEGGERLL